MNSQEGCLREWAPLSDLFNRLPSKTPVGLFFQDVKMTCVDVLTEFIAVGTNLGIVYWYDRKNKDLQRLRCEVSNFLFGKYFVYPEWFSKFLEFKQSYNGSEDDFYC